MVIKMVNQYLPSDMSLMHRGTGDPAIHYDTMSNNGLISLHSSSIAIRIALHRHQLGIEAN